MLFTFVRTKRAEGQGAARRVIPDDSLKSSGGLLKKFMVER